MKTTFSKCKFSLNSLNNFRIEEKYIFINHESHFVLLADKIE